MTRRLSLLLCTLVACNGSIGKRIPELPSDAREQGYVLLPAPIELPEGQTTYDCGPESLGAVLRYWKKPFNVETLSRALINPELRSTATTKIAPFVRRLGFSATLHPGSMYRLKNAIDDGKPPIIAVRLSKVLSHYYVVSGYNDRLQVVVCEEVNNEKTLIPYAKLDDIWRETGYFYLDIAPSTAASDYDAGVEYEKAYNYTSAAEMYRRVLKVDPKFHEARLGLGNCLLAEGRLGEARREYETVLQAMPTDPKALNNLAHVYNVLGINLGVAELHASTAMELYRASVKDLKDRLLKTMTELDQMPLRKDLNERRLQLALAYGTLGQIRFNRRRWVQAIAAWKAAVDLVPLDLFDFRAKRHYEMGLGYRKLRLHSEARKNFGLALEIVRNPKLRRKIEEEIR